MCAIVDANVAHQVFGTNRPNAGVEFFAWLSSGNGSLVLGGKLRHELNKIYSFTVWQKEATAAGRVILRDDGEVDAVAEELKKEGVCKSDDEHVVALAKLSGARLLYSNDDKLQKDFKNKELIDNPRGSVYSTLVNHSFTSTHQNLLRKNICKK